MVENLFIKFVPEKQKFVACHCYKKFGHKSYMCNNRLRTNHNRSSSRIKRSVPSATKKVTQVWIPRRTNPRNASISKKSWIPKLT